MAGSNPTLLGPAISGRVYWTPGWPTTANTGSTFALNNATRLHATMFYWPHYTTWSGCRIDVTTGQTSRYAKVGLYRSSPSGLPGRLWYQFTDQIIAAVAETGAAKAIRMPPGLYWLTIVSDATTAAITAANNSDVRVLGAAAAGDTPDSHLRYTISTWSPGTDLPSDLSNETPTYRSQNPPMIGLRAS